MEQFTRFSGWCRYAQYFQKSSGRQTLAWSRCVLYNFHSELTGTGGASTCTWTWCCKRYGQRGMPAPVYSHWIGLDWTVSATEYNRATFTQAGIWCIDAPPELRMRNVPRGFPGNISCLSASRRSIENHQLSSHTNAQRHGSDVT